MTGRYFVRLLVPDTGAVASEFPCATLGDVAQKLIGLAETVEGEGLYDELGELTVAIMSAGERSLTEQERYHLGALVEEHGGEIPRDDDEAAIFREHNPRRKT